jgi:hypothetical protein
MIRSVRVASDPGKNPPAKTFAALEVAARLWSILVDGAEFSQGVEGDAGAIATLIHAAHSLVLDHE